MNISHAIVPGAVRQQSLAAMQSEVVVEARLVAGAFNLLDGCGERLTQYAGANIQAGVLLLILAKARNFSRSCASLVVDGYGQEAGAILRLWLEAIELFRYLAEDVARVQELLEDRLPSPGARAKMIRGDFHKLRQHLNENSSHLAFTRASLGHVFEPTSGVITIGPTFGINAFRANLVMLFTFTYFTVFETINAMGAANISNEDLLQIWQSLKAAAIPVVVPREPAG